MSKWASKRRENSWEEIEILIEPSDTIRILDKAIEYVKENNIRGLNI